MIEKTIKINNLVYVVYKEFGEYKLTNKQNFDRRIQNANEILTLAGFTDATQIVNYLKHNYQNVEVL